MTAYSRILKMIRQYYYMIGYDEEYITRYFSERVFCELLSIKLANANVVSKNKTDKNSHQTHIAIVGEATEFFGGIASFSKFTKDDVKMIPICVCENNLRSLSNIEPQINGFVTIGIRTQKQLQLSKKSQQNSACFNCLRNLLYENDLLILLKYRLNDSCLCIGLPASFLENNNMEYDRFYETNTYLRLPLKM